MSEVAIATALQYYHTFQSTMEKNRFDENVSKVVRYSSKFEVFKFCKFAQIEKFADL